MGSTIGNQKASLKRIAKLLDTLNKEKASFSAGHCSKLDVWPTMVQITQIRLFNCMVAWYWAGANHGADMGSAPAIQGY